MLLDNKMANKDFHAAVVGHFAKATQTHKKRKIEKEGREQKRKNKMKHLNFNLFFCSDMKIVAL